MLELILQYYKSFDLDLFDGDSCEFAVNFGWKRPPNELQSRRFMIEFNHTMKPMANGLDSIDQEPSYHPASSLKSSTRYSGLPLALR